MAVMDPSGIQISVDVRTARGVTFQLWMGGATSGEGPNAESIFLDSNLGFQDLPIVSSVNIEVLRNYNSTVTIELAAPYDLGLALLESDLFIVGNTIVTQIGYPRIGLFMLPIASFAIKPNLSINPDDGLTATINGQAGAFAGLRSPADTVRQNQSIKDVIDAIANLPRNRWDVVFSARQDDPYDPLYYKRNSISQGGRTDWDEVVRLARIAGCETMVRPQPQGGGPMQLTIFRESDNARAEPVYTLVSRGQIDMRVPNGRFPLLTLESEAEGVWLQRGSVRTTTSDIDPVTGEPTGTVEATDESIADTVPNAVTGGVVGGAAGEQDDVNVSMGSGEQRITAPASSTETTPQERVDQNTREQGARGAGINVTVSTVGNPLAFPGDRIRLENLGLFNGNYEINGISHAVAEGDWSTTLRLIRRGGFDTRFLSEIIRRTQDWDAEDQEPSNQADPEQDADGGGDVQVDPIEEEGD